MLNVGVLSLRLGQRARALSSVIVVTRLIRARVVSLMAIAARVLKYSKRANMLHLFLLGLSCGLLIRACYGVYYAIWGAARNECKESKAKRMQEVNCSLGKHDYAYGVMVCSCRYKQGE